MITTVGRGTPEPAPRLTPQGAGAPHFAVQFSRPRPVSARPDSRTNTFRWTGAGTIHILERGLLVMTRRRSPLGFRTADERFIPASEICEVFRDGDSVRVDLRDEARNTAFFQFWTGNPATAGTIVRLLPTTRTIEYEVAPTEQVAIPRPPLTLHRRRARRRLVQVALAVGLLTVAALLVTDIVMRQTPRVVPEPVKVDVPEAKPVVVTPVPHAAPAEISSALAQVRQFDDRMDGLRAQYRTASLALQSGKLSRDEFIDGINKWLIPQWQALDSELAASRPTPGSLAALVHGRLSNTAIFWERGLQSYAEGLKNNNFNAVMAAFDWMSNGNESRREAWRIVEGAEFESTATSTTARRP